MLASSTPITTEPEQGILQGRVLSLARLIWVFLTLLSIALFLLSLAPGNERTSDFAARPDVSEALRIAGISAETYILLSMLRKVVFGAVFVTVGILLFVRKSTEQFALFVSLTLITFGTVAFLNSNQSLDSYPLWIQGLGEFIQWAGTVTIGLFFYLFPDGRFTPRWTRYPALLWILLQIKITFFPEVPFALPPALIAILSIGFVITWVLAQAMRYRDSSDPMQRQQTKWVALGASIAAFGWFTVTFFYKPALQNIWLTELRPILQLAFFLILPISVAVAMFRYRLWDIDPIVNRTLVYGTLTALVIGLYVLVVSYLSVLFHTQANFVISLIATGIIAVTFQPFARMAAAGCEPINVRGA